MAQCPLCDTQTEIVLSRELRRGNGVVYHCQPCDLGFLVSEHSTNYQYEYRRHASHKSDGSPTNALELFDTYLPYQKDRLNLVRPFVKTDSDVLEIGASSGQFISQLIGNGKRCAVEPDKECCEFMQGLGIDARKQVYPKEKFDVVCAFQTMEHVEEPVFFLKEIRHAMKSGGVAFIEVPNLHDPLRSVWGIPEYEKFYFHQDHRWYFSEKSLRLVVEKSGFLNPEITFVQDYSLLNHLHWLMNKTPQATCHPGLSPVKFSGKDTRMADWLTYSLKAINEMYIRTLVAEGKTSNLMMKLTT